MASDFFALWGRMHAEPVLWQTALEALEERLPSHGGERVDDLASPVFE